VLTDFRTEYEKKKRTTTRLTYGSVSTLYIACRTPKSSLRVHGERKFIRSNSFGRQIIPIRYRNRQNTRALVIIVNCILMDSGRSSSGGGGDDDRVNGLRNGNTLQRKTTIKSNK